MKLRITIKKWVDDPTLSWEERFKVLAAHHTEEVGFFIDAVELLEDSIGLLAEKAGLECSTCVSTVEALSVIDKALG